MKVTTAGRWCHARSSVVDRAVESRSKSRRAGGWVDVEAQQSRWLSVCRQTAASDWLTHVGEQHHERLADWMLKCSRLTITSPDAEGVSGSRSKMQSSCVCVCAELGNGDLASTVYLVQYYVQQADSFYCTILTLDYKGHHMSRNAVNIKVNKQTNIFAHIFVYFSSQRFTSPILHIYRV